MVPRIHLPGWRQGNAGWFILQVPGHSAPWASGSWFDTPGESLVSSSFSGSFDLPDSFLQEGAHLDPAHHSPAHLDPACSFYFKVLSLVTSVKSLLS